MDFKVSVKTGSETWEREKRGGQHLTKCKMDKTHLENVVEALKTSLTDAIGQLNAIRTGSSLNLDGNSESKH